MNLNELRANAYMRQQGGEDGKVVKPFVPPRLEKEVPVPPREKEVRAFVPQAFARADATEKAAESSAASRKPFAGVNRTLDSMTDSLKAGGLLKVPVERPAADGGDSVFRRVAKFLILIGEDEAAKILPHLDESQIEKIITEMAAVRTVGKDEAADILAEFDGLAKQAAAEGGVETARSMLEKAYGKEKAGSLLKKAVPFEGKAPFRYLNAVPDERVYLLLKDENVGVQSIVLSHLEPQKSAKIINLMKPEEKKAVVLRLAKMEPVSPEVISRLNQAMQEKAQNQVTEDTENIDGRNALAQILKKMDAGAERDILSYLSEDDPDLGQDLRSRLFTLEDVLAADDRFVQQELRALDESDIAYLLGGKTDAFREKILSNVSAGRRAEVLAQEELLKPMRRSDCEKVTAEFFGRLRRAYEEGRLVIKGRDDDMFI